MAGEQLLAVYPDLVQTLRANRAFLARAARYLVTGAGSGSSSTSAPGSGREQHL